MRRPLVAGSSGCKTYQSVPRSIKMYSETSCFGCTSCRFVPGPKTKLQVGVKPSSVHMYVIHALTLFPVRLYTSPIMLKFLGIIRSCHVPVTHPICMNIKKKKPEKTTTTTGTTVTDKKGTKTHTHLKKTEQQQWWEEFQFPGKRRVFKC